MTLGICFGTRWQRSWQPMLLLTTTVHKLYFKGTMSHGSDWIQCTETLHGEPTRGELQGTQVFSQKHLQTLIKPKAVHWEWGMHTSALQLLPPGTLAEAGSSWELSQDFGPQRACRDTDNSSTLALPALQRHRDPGPSKTEPASSSKYQKTEASKLCKE